MDPTDLTKLALPTLIAEEIGVDRESSLMEQSIPVNTSWWNERLSRYGLVGGPVVARDMDGGAVTNGPGYISRGDVFGLATSDLNDADSVFRLLWHSLAWGAGSHLRLCDRRMEAVSLGGDDVVQGLIDAAAFSRSDPLQAYRAVCPSTHRNLIKYMGPAFATKFLYFAGGGREDHRCVILDSVVANALRSKGGWTSLSSKGGWPESTYGRYCALAERWASDASDVVGRTVAPDEIEFALFKNGR